ncbi:MAG: PEP-CTERM sorting domain-containing protein [Leptolyngbya foveolarum]|uniref:PEP-CTERM sorting domain-containing protein n=1 Tax=Leptolyngbya foveolarum TaxID=47253 RepID=A0A2W4TW50_9CYAN|nr:MAG: PEP-CTERM sorting domain-containing protein [Leptolyngbya foveolarum]
MGKAFSIEKMPFIISAYKMLLSILAPKRPLKTDDYSAIKRIFKGGSLGVVSLSAVAIALFQPTLPVQATEFSQIYAFGDSLSDTGNAFAKTGLPPEPYFKGHFSNGPVWAEYLADDLGIPETNFAYGGALSGEFGRLQFGSAPAVAVPGALAQAKAFVASSPQADDQALYIIWVGANDYLSGQARDFTKPVDNIRQAVLILEQAGAKNFLLVNLPKLGDLPLFQATAAQPRQIAALNDLVFKHNQALAQTTVDLNRSGAVNVELLDVYTLYESVAAGALGPSDTTDVCTLIAACINNLDTQNSYLFWDSLHPTTAAHRLIADTALEVLR